VHPEAEVFLHPLDELGRRHRLPGAQGFDKLEHLAGELVSLFRPTLLGQ